MPEVTVVLPCWKRPIRTRRAIESVLDQSFTDWELLIEGDGCPHLQELINNSVYTDPRITILNYWPHRGSPGPLMNHMFECAKGKYILFLSNDDFFLPNHIETRYNAIKDTQYDFMYGPAYIRVPEGQFARKPLLECGYIGHSELIVTAEMARKYPHDNDYCHDWRFIENMMNGGAKYAEMLVPPTIVVCHVFGFLELENFD